MTNQSSVACPAGFRERPEPVAYEPLKRTDYMSETDQTQPAAEQTQPEPQDPNQKSRKPKRRRRKPRRSQSKWSLDQFQVAPAAGQWRFHDFDLPLPLMRAIQKAGFEYCTPIQAQTFEKALLGGDVVGRAQTGSGKTAAFLIATLAYFLEEKAPEGQKPGAPRAVIIAPTRELALQIEKDAKAFSEFARISVACVVGGMDYQKQRERLERKVDLLVATPGRLLDFHTKRDVDLSETEVLILDEADRMLSMGFIPDVKRIIRATPKPEERQTLLFSAELSSDVLGLAELWTHKAAQVEVEHEASSTMAAGDSGTVHGYTVSDDDKLRLLINLVKQAEMERVVVFGNTRNLVRRIDAGLRDAGVEVGLMSGAESQAARLEAQDAFRNGKLKVLVVSDVAGRGLPLEDATHVVNFTLPEVPEDYVHRASGSDVTLINFIGEEDVFSLPEIEDYIQEALPRETPPQGLL